MYRGSDVFKTHFGAFISIATRAIILFNLVTLCLQWVDGSKQEETQSSAVFDRYLEDPIKLQDNQFNVTLVDTANMPRSIGRFNAYQVLGGYRNEVKEELGMSDCTTEDRAALDEFWGSHELRIKDMPVSGVRCFYSDSAYIQSESFFQTNFATLRFVLEHCIDYDTPENCASEKDTLAFW